MTAVDTRAMVSAKNRAAEQLAQGNWQAALVEYTAVAKADSTDRTAAIGIARALARGGHLSESYLVLDRALRRFGYHEHQRRNLLESVHAEASAADSQADGNPHDIAAEAGLLVWQHSRWLGTYLVLLLVLSALPVLIGLAQEHYVLIVFGAIAGGALCHLYVIRHRVPVWRLSTAQS